MQAQKRSWLYSAIAHPPSVIQAQAKKKRRLPPGSKLLLAGDEHAWALAPFLILLARDAGVAFASCLNKEDIATWAKKKLLAEATAKASPDLTLVSLHVEVTRPSSVAALQQLVREGRPAGTTLVWLRPPRHDDDVVRLRAVLDEMKVPSFHSDRLALPRGADGEPSARGYAGWAGALWQWIG